MKKRFAAILVLCVMFAAMSAQVCSAGTLPAVICTPYGNYVEGDKLGETLVNLRRYVVNFMIFLEYFNLLY
ncbi:MAG: hypothetical protein IJP48_06050 [Synergistaceae bacterium]|nr:hypothetical protein [Synergistaceae bacterium]